MSPFFPTDLPVAEVLDAVVIAARSGAVVVTAPPGSGKTMLVPAAVLDDLPRGMKLVLMQPRRLAARAVAQQIARLRNVSLGGEVGYQVRFDACVSGDTRLVVETTGIMLRRLLTDVSLLGIGAVVLDEFHERTLEMDLILGLLVRIRQTIRPDLRIVVMSATLAAEPVARLLGSRLSEAFLPDGQPPTPNGCPIVSTAGRVFPVDIRYRGRGEQHDLHELVATAVSEAMRTTDGHTLVFLPGVGEIKKCEQTLAPLAQRQGYALRTLFGDLPAEQQDNVLSEMGQRKIILSTNVAETSLTIPGVTAVIDSGLVRQVCVSSATGLPRLELRPISQASAQQRAGRAGRTGPGICWRLWNESSHHLRAQADTPEVLRGDLAGPLLQLLALGELDNFSWLDAPPVEALNNARKLLFQLGAIEQTKANSNALGSGHAVITPLGRELCRLPAHPRLARLLLAGARHGVLRETSIAAALLSERDPFRAGVGLHSGLRDRSVVRSRSDIVDRVLALQRFHDGMPTAGNDLDPHPAGAHNVLQTAEQLYRLVDGPFAQRAEDVSVGLRMALLEAFPDRLARLRPGAHDRATMVGGRGVRLHAGSRVRQEPFFLAVDINDCNGEASVRQASAVDPAWLEAEPLRSMNIRTVDELLYHPSRRQVEARRRTYWADLMIDEMPIAIENTAAASALLTQEARTQLERVMPAAESVAGLFIARVRWLANAAPDLNLSRLCNADLAEMLPDICIGLRCLDAIVTADWLSRVQAFVGLERLSEIDRMAPVHIELSNGRRHKLLYTEGQPPILAVRIQELFGVRTTPRIVDGRVVLLLHLLGPNHQPQQVTSDLASFWKNTYPNVKKELRRRYPKHAWPDDPLVLASPSANKTAQK